MSEVQLQAIPRSSVGKGLFALRKAGKIPAVLYGPGVESLSIELDSHEATLVLNGISGSTLIHLFIDKKDYPVLLRDLQRDSIRRNILHVDFYVVPSDRAIRVHVPLVFTGVSAAVRDFGGILVHPLSELEVECLPKDLINEIPVDISSIEIVGDSISIKDIPLPPGIRVLMDKDETVVTVTAMREEEEEPVAAVAAALPAEVEVIEKGKKLEEGEEEVEKEGKEIKK